MAFSEHAFSNGQANGHNAAPRTPSGQRRAEDDVTLHDLVETLVKGKWIILGAFLVVLFAVSVYTFYKAPEYEASSTVYVDNQQSNPQLTELLGVETGNRNIANEVEILRSRAIAMRVAEALQSQGAGAGEERPLSVLRVEQGAEPLSTLDIAQRLRKEYITVRPLSREVDLIEVVATSTIPDEAALIANLYAEEYVAYNRTISRSRMTASRQFLSEVTERFGEDLERAEEDLTAFLNHESVVAPEEEARQLIGQITEMQQLQYQTQYELGMAQAELQALQDEVGQVVPGLAQQISSGDNVIIDGLINQIAELELRAEQKYARNPSLRQNPEADDELVQLNREVAALKKELDLRASRLVENTVAGRGSDFGSLAGEGSGGRLSVLQDLRQQIMEKEIQTSGLQARLDIIDEQLGQAKAQLQEIPGKDIILNRLERSLQTREQLYVTLIEKLQEARIAEQSELGYVDIIDEAFVPSKPVRPSVQMNLMLGAVLGLVLGIGLAFVRNAVDNKVRKPEELRRHGYSVLGVVPSMERVIRSDFDGKERVPLNGKEYSTSLIALLNPLSPVAEGYRRLRTNLQFARPDAAGVRTILVTSPGPGEGKTVTSLNLAVTMAQSGRRTIYVDADLRRPMGHQMMGVPREPGLVDGLFDVQAMNIEQFATEVDDLYVVPTGSGVPNPAEILGSRRMREFIERLQYEFDVVVIDTPPVLAVADALSLSGLSDVTLLVCSANETTWHAIEQSTQALQDVGGSITGVILNRFDPKTAYGSYGYGYGYYDYYGEKPKAPTA